MKNFIAGWWRRRCAKHYLKNHWQLFFDIVLVLVVIGLLIAVIIIRHLPAPTVDTSAVPHEAAPATTTTTVIPENSEPLLIKAKLSTSNIKEDAPFTLKLHLENTGASPISQITLVPKVTSGGLVINHLASHNLPDDVSLQGNQIVLNNFASGAVIDLPLQLTASVSEETLRQASWLLKASYTYEGRQLKATVALADLKLIADIDIRAAAYYNSPQGDQLGSGPLPPVAGLPTNYWIFLTAANDNDFSDLTVSARLPQGVTLANGKTLSAGNLSYDESQKRLTWTVKKVAADSGRYQAGFSIQLMPTEKQAGTVPTLVNSLSYQATDDYTGETVSGQLPAITANLTADPINKGQGKVIK